MQDTKVFKIPEATQIGHVHLKVADLDDPDKNGVELNWDRPKQYWPRKTNGSLEMYTRSLDLNKLLKEIT